VPEDRCEEQATLAHAVVVAITAVYGAKRDLDEARDNKLDTALLSIALHDARTIERHAVRALDTHKLEHKCANVPVRSVNG
jgi:hypothetical protein